MIETVEQSIQEDRAKELAEELQFARKARKVGKVRLSVGLFVGLAILLSGIVLITSGGFGSLGLLTTGSPLLAAGAMDYRVGGSWRIGTQWGPTV